MELYEFTKILKELGDYYERTKEPRHGTIELWFDKVKNIPTEPISWIISKIEADNESFPKNLPVAVWEAYRDWMQANPNRTATKASFDCPDCADGLIWVLQESNGYPRQSFFRCARCKQNTVQAYPMASRQELMATYQVIPKEGEPYGTRRPRNVREMAADIGG